MWVSWFRWIFRSRRRTVSCFALIATCVLVPYFWVDVCLWAADANLVHRNVSGAAQWIDRASWFCRDIDARTCLLQIRVARRRNEFHEVETKLQQAIKLGAPRAEVQRQLWLAMAQSNQFESMQTHWTELLNDARDDEPEIARSYYAWAMLNHQLDAARKALELWHQDAPRDPEPLLLLGHYCQATLDWEGAENSLRKALAIAAGNDEVRLALAIALQARLKTSEAIPLFEGYLRNHPDELTAMHGLAHCFTTKGDVESALRLLSRAYEKHPNDITIQKAYGELLLSGGKPDEAAMVLENAYELAPENANLANVLARAWKASGRKADAEPLFAFVAESRPQIDELLVIEKEMRSQPNNLELRMRVANITAKYVSRQDAIRWYKNILLISPKYGPAHKAIAELYRLVGDEKLADYHADFAQRSSR